MEQVALLCFPFRFPQQGSRNTVSGGYAVELGLKRAGHLEKR